MRKAPINWAAIEGMWPVLNSIYGPASMLASPTHERDAHTYDKNLDLPQDPTHQWGVAPMSGARNVDVAISLYSDASLREWRNRHTFSLKEHAPGARSSSITAILRSSGTPDLLAPDSPPSPTSPRNWRSRRLLDNRLAEYGIKPFLNHLEWYQLILLQMGVTLYGEKRGAM